MSLPLLCTEGMNLLEARMEQKREMNGCLSHLQRHTNTPDGSDIENMGIYDGGNQDVPHNIEGSALEDDLLEEDVLHVIREMLRATQAATRYTKVPGGAAPPLPLPPTIARDSTHIALDTCPTPTARRMQLRAVLLKHGVAYYPLLLCVCKKNKHSTS